MRFKGKDIIVFIGADEQHLAAIAAGTECSLEMDAELLEKASPTTGQWKEYKTKRKGWSVSASVMLDSANKDVLAGLLGGETFISFEYNPTPLEGITTDRVHNASAYICYKGNAICNKVQINAKHKDMVTASVSFQGNGALQS